MKLYTKAGDTGLASTLTRQNIPKSSPIFALLGTLDELSCAIGAAKLQAAALHPVLEQLQEDLIALSGELAGGKPFADAAQVARLEKAIDAATEENAAFVGFVLPGKTSGGAALDTARTVARRAERCAVEASQTGGISRAVLAWMNRLSDLLYALARLSDREQPSVVTDFAAAEGEILCDRALELCQAVRRFARSAGVPVVTAVCDAGGNPLALLREETAFIASVDIALNKAYTAAALKMSTEELGRLAQPGGSLYGIQQTNGGRIVIFGGGVPLRKNGQVIGGFGVSGGTAEQDTAFGRFATEYFEKEMGSIGS